MKQGSKLWVSVIGLIAAALIVVVVGRGIAENRAVTTTAGKLNVVASLDQYGEIAKEVGGKYVKVTSVINKSTMDPHDYEPTANIAKVYQKAALIISNGGGYDEWSTRFAEANKKAMDINIAKMVGYKDGDNEHFWYTPSVPAKLVDKIQADLTKLDKKHAAEYKANAAAYKKQLAALDETRTEVRGMVKGKNALATEPVYDNTLTDLDVHVLVPEFAHAVEEGQDPSSATIRDWQESIDAGHVAFVINNSQTTSKLVDQAVAYARDRHVPIVDVTETKPDGMTYIEWQQDQLNALREALQ